MFPGDIADEMQKQAKYKYQSWEKYHKEGLTKEDAQKKYAETVDELEKKYVNK